MSLKDPPRPHQLPSPEPQLLLFALSLQRALSDVQVGESQRSPRMTSPLAWWPACRRARGNNLLPTKCNLVLLSLVVNTLLSPATTKQNHGPRRWGSLDAEKAPEVTTDGCEGEAQGHEGQHQAGLDNSFLRIPRFQHITESRISDTPG